MPLAAQDPRLGRLLVNVGDLSFRRRIRAILGFLQVRDDDVVLDAGCGEGFYVMLLSELTRAQIVGIDTNPKLVAQAQRWIGERPTVCLLVGDIARLPFPDRTFTKVICSEVLEHVPGPVPAVGELHRVLRDDGVLAVTVPNRRYPLLWDPLNWVREHLGLGHFPADREWIGGMWANHLRLYTPEMLRTDLGAGGFAVSELCALTKFCLPFHHHVLYTGRQAYTRLPVPESVRLSMEKFEWGRVQTVARWDPAWVLLRGGLKLLEVVDRANDRPLDVDGPSVHLAARAHKIRPAD